MSLESCETMSKEVDLWDIMCRVLVGLVLVGSLVGGCSALNKRLGLKDDNPVEEYIEEQIEDHTGIEIDLSGDSKE